MIATILVIGCLLAYASYAYYKPQVNFQEYVPTKLPTGMSIGSKTVELWSSPLLPFWPLKTNVRVSLGGRISLLEEKLTSNLATNGCSLVVNQKCKMAHTIKGQAYRLVATYVQPNPTNDDRPTSVVTTFDKGGTRILINIDQTVAQVPFDWNNFIDSFVATTFNDFDVTHMHPGP